MQQPSYCLKCNRIKFPRTHHCKQCKTCILRMDHHCPWIGNCVGLHNHKFFILFLIYATLSLMHVVVFIGIFYTIGIDPEFYKGLSLTEETQIQINGITSLALMLAIGFLGCFQIYYASKNITTVEYHIPEMHDKNPFDKSSFRQNLSQIFGIDTKNWLLPVHPTLRIDDELIVNAYPYDYDVMLSSV